jgi:hypothetical protein
LNTDDDTWPLIVSWLIAALHPGIQYPILTLFAEQGTGKSTASRMIRNCVDPNESPLRSEPRNEQDLMIAAKNSWVLAFDNLSYVSPWMSDAMCRISTGGGFATRTLYENDEETIFNAKRPALITSIEDIATKSDMLDRAIIVRLTAIDESRRRPESELLNEYELARPHILGALLDAVVCGLENYPHVKLSKLPRMADFAKWVVACEPGLGWPVGRFLELYNANRGEANELALEATPIAKFLLEHLECQPWWTGTAGQLLEELNRRAGYGGDSKTRFRFVAASSLPNSATASTALKSGNINSCSNDSYMRSQAADVLRPPATATPTSATATHDGPSAEFATATGHLATALRPQNSLMGQAFSGNTANAVSSVAPVANFPNSPGDDFEFSWRAEDGVA